MLTVAGDLIAQIAQLSAGLQIRHRVGVKRCSVY